MARLIPATWSASQEAFGARRNRRPCRYEAYVPDLLADRPFDLDAEMSADVVDVEVALASFDATAGMRPDLEQLARFLLRAEAVASSRIEGLRVGSRRLARHEARVAHGDHPNDATADAVLGSIEAMRLAIDVVASATEVTVGHILEMHQTLLARSMTPELGGVVRDRQNWIGGNDFNPCSAEFVPPPPEFVDPLLEDLCAFINRDDLPAVVQAGMVHAQFETIHPFADGNGRTGRALIHVVLRRRRSATAYVPPISLALATNSRAYIAGLIAYRYVESVDSAVAAEAMRLWLEVFLEATHRSVMDASRLGQDLEALEARWRAAATPRRGSAADRALVSLLSHPVVSVDDVATLVGVSFQAANVAVQRLVGAGVLEPTGGASRNRLFEAPEVLSLLTRYERSVATPSGNTRQDSPARPVPDRR